MSPVRPLASCRVRGAYIGSHNSRNWSTINDHCPEWPLALAGIRALGNGVILWQRENELFRAYFGGDLEIRKRAWTSVLCGHGEVGARDIQWQAESVAGCRWTLDVSVARGQAQRGHLTPPCRGPTKRPATRLLKAAAVARMSHRA
jgi:hypothetical protein